MSSHIQGQKYCSGCAAVIHQSAQFCPHCGAQAGGYTSYGAAAPPYSPPHHPYPAHAGRSKVAAGILALLLGGFGIHKFYLGRGGQGVVYLLLFWTFIPAVIAFIEGIIYLTMSEAHFDAKYNRYP